MKTDTETIREIANSEDPDQTIESAYRDDEIRIEGVGLTNEVKWNVITGAGEIARRVSFGSLLDISLTEIDALPERAVPAFGLFAPGTMRFALQERDSIRPWD